MTTTKVPQTPKDAAFSNVIDFAAYRAKRATRRRERDPLAQSHTRKAGRGPATAAVENLRRVAELAALLVAAGTEAAPAMEMEPADHLIRAAGDPARVEHHIRRFLSEGDFVRSEIAAAEERERVRARSEHAGGAEE